MQNEKFMYDDIIELQYVKSTRHKHMTQSDRAAQFAPFAALTGHDDAISETARLTQKRIELDEYSKEQLNYKLICIQQIIESLPEITVTYFVPDDKKNGGKYTVLTDRVVKIKEFERVVVMENKTEIPIDDIFEIDGEAVCKLCE